MASTHHYLEQRTYLDWEAHYDHKIDAMGLRSCPLPMLSTFKLLSALCSGEVMKVISADKDSPGYFDSLVQQTGLELVDWVERKGEFSFHLRKN